MGKKIDKLMSLAGFSKKYELNTNFIGEENSKNFIVGQKYDTGEKIVFDIFTEKLHDKSILSVEFNKSNESFKYIRHASDTIFSAEGRDSVIITRQNSNFLKDTYNIELQIKKEEYSKTKIAIGIGILIAQISLSIFIGFSVFKSSFMPLKIASKSQEVKNIFSGGMGCLAAFFCLTAMLIVNKTLGEISRTISENYKIRRRDGGEPTIREVDDPANSFYRERIKEEKKLFEGGEESVHI